MNDRRLWAPWRAGFVMGRKPRGCLFCRLPKARPPRRQFIVARGTLVYAVLNRYPYTNGHCLIVPYRHVALPARLTDREWVELLRVTEQLRRRLDRILKPRGYNYGINIGRAAGAGIPGHLHLHLVPRWEGDANFISTVGGTRVISQSLETLYRELTRAPAA